jgi:hypothetical protein
MTPEKMVVDASNQPQDSYADLMIRRAEAAGDASGAEYWRRVKADVDKAPPLGPRQKTLLRSLLYGPRDMLG